MAYIDCDRIFNSALAYWIERQYLRCIEVQTDTSVAGQLYRHYREQFIIKNSNKSLYFNNRYYYQWR